LQLELELTKARQQFEVDMKNLALEDDKIRFGNVDSARRRDAAVQTSANASRLGKNVPPFLALGTTILTFILFGMLMFYGKTITQERRGITLYILGVLSAVLTQIFGFYYGSSQGSAEKNSMIRSLTEGREGSGNR